jgi:hypothetical protein
MGQGDPSSQHQAGMKPAQIVRILSSRGAPERESPLEALFDRVAPAQVYVPKRKFEEFDKIAELFNKADLLGIVFNAYNFKTREAVLYDNPTLASRSCSRRTSRAVVVRNRHQSRTRFRIVGSLASCSRLVQDFFSHEHVAHRKKASGAYLPTRHTPSLFFR